MESRWTPETSESDLGGQNSISCDVLYIIGKLLERRCLKWARIAHLDIWNTSYGKKKGPGVKLPVWLPTRKSRESTRFIWLQTTCHIPLESSRRELQLCFRPHFDPRSARKVMGLQSRRSPGREKSFGCGPRGEVQSIIYGGRWWLPPSPGRGESCVFVLPVAHPNTKGALTMH